MKKILLILLIVHTTIYSEQERPDIDTHTNDNTTIISNESRAVNQSTPVIDFYNQLIINPNHTPVPTQPAQIANVQSLIVYIAGAKENGPFGNPKSTNNQINAINNANLFSIPNNVNKDQSTYFTKQAINQNHKAQLNAIGAAGIASSKINNSSYGVSQTINILNGQATSASDPSSTRQTTDTKAVSSSQLAQQAAFASVTNNAKQSASQITANQIDNNPNSILQNIQNERNQDAINNPNPFVTINNPTPQSKIVTWNTPLIIDNNNEFFNTISTIKFEENIVYKPSLSYRYPPAYIDCPAAIIIAIDNITIDLAGFNLSLDPASAPGFLNSNPIYGISIAPGVKNTKIISSTSLDKKGSISGFPGFAIFGEGNYPSFNFNKYDSMINTVIIDNIVMLSNLGGISMTHALQVEISNVDIYYSFGSRIIYGIYFENVLNGLIKETTVNQNHSYLDVVGIYLLDTVGILINKCTAGFNRSLQYGYAVGMQITGSSLTTSHDNTISNCVANGNLCSYVTARESVGILINGDSTNNYLYNNITNSNSFGPVFNGATPPITNPKGYGIKLDSTFKNQIYNNTAGYNGDYGFYDSAAISTSFFSKNTALFNDFNYDVTIETSAITIGPLPTVVLYQYNLATYTGSSTLLENIEITNP